jgi:hemerythrin-like domain-containing protein
MSAMPVATPGDYWLEPRAGREDGFIALNACHRRMLAAAGALEDLVEAIERNGVSPAVQASAAAIAEFYATTAAQHHEDEERHIFPALLVGRDADLVRAVRRLQEDHIWLEESWLELEPHVLAIATGYGADLDLLRDRAQVFAALHRDHIRLEESLAYPQAQMQLGEEERRAMGREMTSRRRAARAAACADPRTTGRRGAR